MFILGLGIPRVLKHADLSAESIKHRDLWAFVHWKLGHSDDVQPECHDRHRCRTQDNVLHNSYHESVFLPSPRIRIVLPISMIRSHAISRPRPRAMPNFTSQARGPTINAVTHS